MPAITAIIDTSKQIKSVVEAYDTVETTNILHFQPKPKNMEETNKPKLPEEFISDLFRAFAKDACVKNTFGCEVLNEFELKHGCEITDVIYSRGVLSIYITEKWRYHFQISFTEI